MVHGATTPNQATNNTNNSMNKKSAASTNVDKDIYSVIEEMATREDYIEEGYQPFVYAIVFDDGKWYIGCKYSEHYGAHPNMILNEEYQTSSKTVQEKIANGASHTRYILGLGDKHEVTLMEKKLVEELWGVEGRMNQHMPYGQPKPPISQETRDKLSKANKGKVISQETRDKLSKANKGKVISQETRDKISKAQKGRVWSQEQKDNVSKAQKSRVVSQEHKDKISKANKGKVVSQEVRDKISKAQRGKIVSQETREKLSKAWAWPQDKIDVLLSMYKSGVFIAAISREFGCAPPTIARRLKMYL